MAAARTVMVVRATVGAVGTVVVGMRLATAASAMAGAAVRPGEQVAGEGER